MIKNDKRVSFFKGGKSVMLKYGSSNSHLTHKEHGSREILKERQLSKKPKHSTQEKSKGEKCKKQKLQNINVKNAKANKLIRDSLLYFHRKI